MPLKLRDISAFLIVFLIFAFLGLALFGTGPLHLLSIGMILLGMGFFSIVYLIKSIRAGTITVKENTYTRAGFPFSYWLHCFLYFIFGPAFLLTGASLVIETLLS